MKFLTMNDMQVPVLGFGTWQLEGDACYEAVKNALAMGYRHIDTAQAYNNEADVGRAIAESGITRDELFVTTKVWIDNASAAKVRSSTVASLKKLQLDHVNLLLLHWPVKNVPLEETLHAMKELQKEGLARAIGVSNFTVPLMKEALEILGCTLSCNQVEYHIELSQQAVLDYARQHNIVVTAYSPLVRGQLLKQPVLKQIGEKYRKTPAQIALRWLVEQENVMAIPKAANKMNAKENLEIFDFQLDAKDHHAIETLGKDQRLVNPSFAPVWDNAA